MNTFVILIPTYNESLSIRELLDKLGVFRANSDENFDLIILDDNSPDKTAQIVDSLSIPWVRVVRRPDKHGLGAAYRAGFCEVIRIAKYTHVLTMDADGSHRVEDLPVMFDALKDFDTNKTVVMGTRWIPGGSVTNWSNSRKFLSLFGTKYAKFALGLKLDDLTGGFRIYSLDLLKSLNLQDMHATGYCFQIEMALASKQAGAEIIQVPITFVERSFGKSKMTVGIAFEAFRYVTRAGLERVFKGYIRR
jgi:dolichol-phosphate mannosyltransferase